MQQPHAQYQAQGTAASDLQPVFLLSGVEGGENREDSSDPGGHLNWLLSSGLLWAATGLVTSHLPRSLSAFHLPKWERG